MRRLGLWIALALIILAVGAFLFVTQVPRFIEHSGILDRQMESATEFSLCFAAGQIELHRLRHGRYPAGLSDIEHAGEIGRGMLMGVRYHTDEEGTAYYLEVPGRPADPEWPSGFWEGTGFTERLNPGRRLEASGEG